MAVAAKCMPARMLLAVLSSRDLQRRHPRAARGRLPDRPTAPGVTHERCRWALAPCNGYPRRPFCVAPWDWPLMP